MGFKSYMNENKIERENVMEKLQKAFSLIESLNSLNKIPDHKKSIIAIELEKVIREKINSK